jgi:hypothetical protein
MDHMRNDVELLEWLFETRVPDYFAMLDLPVKHRRQRELDEDHAEASARYATIFRYDAVDKRGLARVDDRKTAESPGS